MIAVDNPKYVLGGYAKPSASERLGAIVSPIFPGAVPTFEVEFDDISKWNGANIDFTMMRKYAQFAVVRGGYGDTGLDPLCDQHMQGLLDAGMERSVYWFLMPRTATNWQQTLESFKIVWNRYDIKIPPVFDCEYSDLSPTETSKWLYNLKTNWIRDTGVKPIIYTRKNWWETNTLKPAWAAELFGWFAQYNDWVSSPAIPSPWNSWFGWQWSANGNGEGHKHGANCDDMDRNRCSMSILLFNKTFGTNIEPLGYVPPPVEFSKVKVLRTINPRTIPLVASYTDAGTITAGVVLTKAGEPENGFQPVIVWLSPQHLKEVN